jgi:hypothetical protein
MKKRIQMLLGKPKRKVSRGTRCSICALPLDERNAVNLSLTNGEIPLTAIADQLGISKASVSRHAQNHLLPAVKRELQAAIAGAPGVLEGTQSISDVRTLNARIELEPLYRKARALMDRTEAENDYSSTRGFLSESRQLLELCGRFDGAFGDTQSNGPNVVIVIPQVVVAAEEDVQTIDSKLEK